MTLPSAERLSAHSSLLHGRSELALRAIPDNTFDAIVTDPPYEVDFARQVNQSWDATGIAFSVDLWAEAMRTVKPGGNLIAFGAPRTHHRLVTAVENAGWEVREGIVAWVKSYGFPKRLELQELLVKRGRPDLAERFAGAQNVMKPAHEPILIARKPLDGDLVDNIIKHGVGGLGIDACRVPTDDDRSRPPGKAIAGDVLNMSRGSAPSSSHPGGRWPTNMVLIHGPDCVEGGPCEIGCPAAELERQKRGTARYFPQFHYSGRASGRERPIVDGVRHHTVKPVALMEWLVKLACPAPGMKILDPFAGTGATAEAAERVGLGHETLLIEQSADHIPLVRERFRTLVPA